LRQYLQFKIATFVLKKYGRKTVPGIRRTEWEMLVLKASDGCRLGVNSTSKRFRCKIAADSAAFVRAPAPTNDASALSSFV
jgi:hypothetical protein